MAVAPPPSTWRTPFWLKVVGTGGPITLTTVRSNFDTVVAVYKPNQTPPSAANALFCNDDNRGDDVELTFPSVAGATYYTQWGGCAGCAGGSSGRMEFAILTNDARAFAAPAISRTRTNMSATTVTGEIQSCGTAPYGRTVWFRYAAPAAGDVTSRRVRLRPGDSPVPRRRDEPVHVQRRRRRQPPELDRRRLRATRRGPLPPGWGQGGGDAAVDFHFILNVTFAEDLDIDNDGYNKKPGPDCDDGDLSVHPQQVELPNNGKDDDCAGGDSHDTDLDGQDARPYGPDCNDGNDKLFPGAAEIRGNFVDENCDDGMPAARLSPIPDVSYGHVAVLHGRLFGVLKVTSMGKGYRVAVRCRGSSRCPGKFSKTTRTGRAVSTTRDKGVLPPGAEVEIRVTKPGANRFGYFVEYKVVAPRDLIKRTCTIQPGSGRLTGCRRA